LDINEKLEGRRVDPDQLGKGGMLRRDSQTSLERELALLQKNRGSNVSKEAFNKMMQLESARSNKSQVFNETSTSPMNMSANLQKQFQEVTKN
jgi:hypothetical protein